MTERVRHSPELEESRNQAIKRARNFYAGIEGYDIPVDRPVPQNVREAFEWMKENKMSPALVLSAPISRDNLLQIGNGGALHYEEDLAVEYQIPLKTKYQIIPGVDNPPIGFNNGHMAFDIEPYYGRESEEIDPIAWSWHVIEFAKNPMIEGERTFADIEDDKVNGIGVGNLPDEIAMLQLYWEIANEDLLQGITRGSVEAVHTRRRYPYYYSDGHAINCLVVGINCIPTSHARDPIIFLHSAGHATGNEGKAHIRQSVSEQSPQP